jgi:hypothetical protein
LYGDDFFHGFHSLELSGQSRPFWKPGFIDDDRGFYITISGDGFKLGFDENKKTPNLLPKMSAPGRVFDCRIPRNLTHLFGNPAVLKVRIRGFASPDFSGFALSEIFTRHMCNGKNLYFNKSTNCSRIQEGSRFFN